MIRNERARHATPKTTPKVPPGEFQITATGITKELIKIFLLSRGGLVDDVGAMHPCGDASAYLQTLPAEPYPISTNSQKVTKHALIEHTGRREACAYRFPVRRRRPACSPKSVMPKDSCGKRRRGSFRVGDATIAAVGSPPNGRLTSRRPGQFSVASWNRNDVAGLRFSCPSGSGLCRGRSLNG
jgi:hypothetical protein